jgi:hypothetical protein
MTHLVNQRAAGATLVLCLLAPACAPGARPEPEDEPRDVQDEATMGDGDGSSASPEPADAAEPEQDATAPAPTDASAPGLDASAPTDAGGDEEEDAARPLENRFFDDFDSFERGDTWSCEYTCPTAVDGATRYALEPGIAPDQYGSWSKIGYRPRRFTAGRFTVRFALSARPSQKVWWGAALWDDGPSADGSQFNEINFGYTTAHSFTNTQLYFESARRGNAVSVKVDTGVDLYDGSFHTATLEYDATRVVFYFDGVLMEIITDPTVIPTDPMKFILGPRLVTGSAPLDSTFTELIDFTEIEW